MAGPWQGRLGPDSATRTKTKQVRIGDPRIGTRICEKSESNLRKNGAEGAFIVARSSSTRFSAATGRKADFLIASGAGRERLAVRASDVKTAALRSRLAPIWWSAAKADGREAQNRPELAPPGAWSSRRLTASLFGRKSPNMRRDGNALDGALICSDQSIAAALRMQTMVACARPSARLEMRWGLSQR